MCVLASNISLTKSSASICNIISRIKFEIFLWIRIVRLFMKKKILVISIRILKSIGSICGNAIFAIFGSIEIIIRPWHEDAIIWAVQEDFSGAKRIQSNCGYSAVQQCLAHITWISCCCDTRKPKRYAQMTHWTFIFNQFELKTSTLTLRLDDDYRRCGIKCRKNSRAEQQCCFRQNMHFPTINVHATALWMGLIAHRCIVAPREVGWCVYIVLLNCDFMAGVTIFIKCITCLPLEYWKCCVLFFWQWRWRRVTITWEIISEWSRARCTICPPNIVVQIGVMCSLSLNHIRTTDVNRNEWCITSLCSPLEDWLIRWTNGNEKKTAKQN